MKPANRQQQKKLSYFVQTHWKGDYLYKNLFWFFQTSEIVQYILSVSSQSEHAKSTIHWFVIPYSPMDCQVIVSTSVPIACSVIDSQFELLK